jgi:hypothetical protein
MSDEMKDEYDFSKAPRGRFFRQDAALAPPVHLDPEVLPFLTARAQARGISLNELVNALLKKDIERSESFTVHPPYDDKKKRSVPTADS